MQCSVWHRGAVLSSVTTADSRASVAFRKAACPRESAASSNTRRGSKDNLQAQMSGRKVKGRRPGSMQSTAITPYRLHLIDIVCFKLTTAQYAGKMAYDSPDAQAASGFIKRERSGNPNLILHQFKRELVFFPEFDQQTSVQDDKLTTKRRRSSSYPETDRRVSTV